MTTMAMPAGRGGGIMDMLRGTPAFPRQPSPLDMAVMAPGTGEGLPTMGGESGMADALPLAAPKKMGILDRIKSGLEDPEMRAALLRSGATALSTGNIGGGILAGAEFMDGRKRLRAEEERAAKDYALRERGVNTQERSADATIRQGDRRIDIDQQQTNQTGDYQQGQLRNDRYRTDVGFENSERDRSIRQQLQDDQQEWQTSERQGSQTFEQFMAEKYNKGVPQAQQNSPNPAESRGILNNILPSVSRGVAGFDDQKNFAAALQSNPELFGELSDAAAIGYQRGGNSGAIAAAQGVLSKYKYQPFYDGWTGDTPASFKPVQQQAGSGVVARPKSEAEYNALPSGAVYISPDGQQMRKP